MARTTLAPLDEAKISSQLDENSADWEYIENEMIKFGSLFIAL